jgi:cysteine-rich repeat protein
MGETCEANTPTPCPANCDDNNACTADTSTGSAANCNLVCNHADITQAANNDGCCPPGASANNDSDCRAVCGNKVVEAGEQCDDGNQNAGDGCVDCRTESPLQMCLATIGATDTCAQCTCNKCTAQGNACYAAKDANDVTLCKNMVECGRAQKCGNPDCFCGDVNLILCLGGVANGKCQNEVTAAAKSGALLDINARSTDTNFPLGRANAISDCVGMNCATECGR